MGAAVERGLLYLHEQKVIILQQGLAVFRQAMTIRILPEAKGRRYTGGDFSSLREHYNERTFQIHVMNKYASLGLEKITSALSLVAGYFSMTKSEFVKTYFAGEEKMLKHATGAESYQQIVDQLNNPVQIAVVASGMNRNMLVLAGPGSGKTRVIAHRCAYLLRVERVRAREILVVCFNRAAVVSLRQRIRALAGRDAMGVTIQTYHGLAMRLIGTSFAGRLEGGGESLDLDAMIPKATAMLRGECVVPGLERDEMRERLLAGYRHILIDEYQDIDQPQYDLISAIAGRTLDAAQADAKLSILAVGDDDQNVYTFRGANIRFIREFERDYQAQIHYMVENYRSSASIIDAANQLITVNRDRMKNAHPIQINSARQLEPCGKPVLIVSCKNKWHQARAVLAMVKNKRARSERVAVLSRTKDELQCIRAALLATGIPTVNAADSSEFPLHQTRESMVLIHLLRTWKKKTVRADLLEAAFHKCACYHPKKPWCILLDHVLAEWAGEYENQSQMPQDVIDFIYEALHEMRRENGAVDAVYLSTVHAAKGLEFDHVILLSEWKHQGNAANCEEERRLYYVGMTRARQSLMLCEQQGVAHPFTPGLSGPSIRRAAAPDYAEPDVSLLRRRYAVLGLMDVWIGYAVSGDNERWVPKAIAALEVGDPVTLQADGPWIYIENKIGRRIGALSKQGCETWHALLPGIIEARIYAVICRHDSQHEKSWEVPLVAVWVN